MALHFLRYLAALSLPVTVSTHEGIEAVRNLVLAGMVKAEIPQPKSSLTGLVQDAARVNSITEMGWQMLSCFPAT
jgi:hypothetical protein